jgi:hypothetical protein
MTRSFQGSSAAFKGCAAACLVALGGAVARAQQYLVTDTTNRAVMLIDGTNGTLTNAQFIPESTSGNYTFSLPIEAIQVNGEIWVADQVSDQLIRFDINGNWISTLGAGLDNLRGLAYHNGRVYLVNFGTANGAPGKRILVYDLTGAQVASFPTGDLFDVAIRGNELLVSNTLLDDLERYSLSGTFLGAFHSSDGVTGIDFPSQVTPLPSGEVLAAGQSAPVGFYLYNASGVQTNVFTTTSAVRGVVRTDAGKYLYSTNSGVFLFDPVTTLTSDVAINLAPYYINPYRPPGPPESYCTAGVSSQGCSPQLSHTGTASASASSGFVITAIPIDAQRSATFFYGVNGRQALPWATGSTSFFCVRAPIQRTPTQNTGGTVGNCNGLAALDWNAFAAANPSAVGQPYVFGTMVNAQCWFRDPPAPKSTNLSNALEFFLQP